MDRGLRIYIMKSDRIVIFPNNFRRNLTRDNFFEDRHGKSEVRSQRSGISNQRSEHFSRSLVVDVSRSRMKQTSSSRKASQARVQTRVQRKCFTHACNEQSCKLSTPVSISELSRFSRRSKKASS